MIQFDRLVCRDFEAAASREWLETNGLGGFASSTITGANTRRYHGLLTAATRPPVGRVLLLSKLEETLVLDSTRTDISSNEYTGALHPRGFEAQSAFRLDPWPVFTFDVAGARIEKSVFMVHGSNITVITYRVLSSLSSGVILELRPLIAFRDYHSLTHENNAIDKDVMASPNLLSVAAYRGLPALFLAHNADEVEDQGYWYRQFLYRVERERGLECLEDLFNPLMLRFQLASGEVASVIASTEACDIATLPRLEAQERRRRAQIVARATTNDDFVRTLTVAADQYIVRRGGGYSVIAGYPWFTDWGRDTMIALPGLTLATGQHEIARDILGTFAESVNQGMLPNRFPDEGEEPEYNSVDATLWFFEAIRAYLARTRDYTFARELYPILANIVDWHIRGTRYGIKVLENGLLRSGVAGAQLTWMDAKIGDWVVTPRSGCPVEIQALWFNALKTMQSLAHQLGIGSDAQRFASIAALTEASFQGLFWNERRQCLYDVVNGANDDSLRPNQVIAASLEYPLITGDRARRMLATVEANLLTPPGLRTLDPGSPNYAGRYIGAPPQRDAVYHQGTVWPWLLGQFASAYVRAHDGSTAARERTCELLFALQAHLGEAGLGQISEIFDGDAPHSPRGCFAQAWSVSEILRASTDSRTPAAANTIGKPQVRLDIAPAQ